MESSGKRYGVGEIRRTEIRIKIVSNFDNLLFSVFIFDSFNRLTFANISDF